MEFKKDNNEEITESKIRNTIKSYRQNLPNFGLSISTLGILITLLVAATTFSSENTKEFVLKIIFYVLSAISFVFLIIFTIIQVKKYKTGKGTEDWFVDELFNNHQKNEPKKKKPKIVLFKTLVYILVPVCIFLIIPAINGFDFAWIHDGASEGVLGLILWSIGTVFWLIFGLPISEILYYSITENIL